MCPRLEKEEVGLAEIEWGEKDSNNTGQEPLMAKTKAQFYNANYIIDKSLTDL